jgi:hypothetical protein
MYKKILHITMALHGYPRPQGGFASHICHEHDDEDWLLGRCSDRLFHTKDLLDSRSVVDLRFSSSIREGRRSANGRLFTGGSKRAKEKEMASGVVLGAFVDSF